MCRHHSISGGHVTEVRTFAQRVEAIAETLGDVPLQVAAQYYSAFVCHTSGDYRGTEDVCRRLTQSLQGDRIRERFGLSALPAMWSRAYRGARPRRARRVRRGRRSRTRSHPDCGSARSPVQRHLRVSGARVCQQRQGRAEPGRPPARARARSRPRLEHHTNALRSPWRPLGTYTRGRDASAKGVSLLQQALTAHESAGIGMAPDDEPRAARRGLPARGPGRGRSRLRRPRRDARPRARRTRPRGVGPPPPWRDHLAS